MCTTHMKALSINETGKTALLLGGRKETKSVLYLIFSPVPTERLKYFCSQLNFSYNFWVKESTILPKVTRSRKGNHWGNDQNKKWSEIPRFAAAKENMAARLLVFEKQLCWHWCWQRNINRPFSSCPPDGVHCLPGNPVTNISYLVLRLL